MLELYVVTDRALSKGRDEAETARLAFEGGADAVQLRMKDAPGGIMLRQARAVKRAADEHGGLFIVNDRVDIAVLSEADGVHLGQEDIPVAEARRLVGDGMLIGMSVKTLAEAVDAVEQGADYLGVGAVFPTATKADAGYATGLDPIHLIRRELDVPVVAIGGINRGNIADVIAAGADGAAVVSAVVAQDDIPAAVRELRGLVLRARRT